MTRWTSIATRPLVAFLLGVVIVVVAVIVGRRWLPEPAEEIEWVRRPEAVVVQIKTAGGLPQSEVFDRATVPDFILYGDGALIFTDPATRGQASDAPVLRSKLSEEEVRDLLESIRNSGFMSFNYAQPKSGALDQPTTFIYVNTREAANSVSGYGLDSSGPAGKEWNEFRKLKEIKSRLDAAATDAVARGDAKPYVAGGIVLIVQFTQPTRPGRPMMWAIPEISLASIAGESGIGERRIDSELAREVQEKVSSDRGGAYAQDGQPFSVAYRPVLPYEENFPEFEPPVGAQTP